MHWTDSVFYFDFRALFKDIKLVYFNCCFSSLSEMLTLLLCFNLFYLSLFIVSSCDIPTVISDEYMTYTICSLNSYRAAGYQLVYMDVIS